MLERGGVMQAVERSGSHVNPVRVLANLVFWLVMFAVILVAANALGLESLANVFSNWSATSRASSPPSSSSSLASCSVASWMA